MFEGVIMLVLGASFLLTIIVIVHGEFRLTRRCTAMTAGTVLRLDAERDQHGTVDNTYYVVRYKVNGIEYETMTSSSGYDREYKPGDPMDVDYDPNDPKTARATVDRTNHVSGLIILLVVVFAAMTIGGAWIVAMNVG